MRPDDQHRWREADAALDRLLDLPEAERAAALRALPHALRPLVERLLAADADSGVLDLEPTELEPVPRRAGPWRIGAEIGRGGMSVVYGAERDVEGAVQSAALKLVTVGALAAQGRERFRREHALLARLSHPHIVGLLDAGTLDDGTPYLVTRLVEGERIDRWCWRQGLDATAVVRLFLQVCEAVAAAHRQLVVHLDLKPANILVDARGHVHLLDFGIARLLEEAGDGHMTRTQWRAFTPEFAAPEQLDGGSVGVAADVFGLGAVLYHVLTGRPPRPGGGTAAQITLPSRAAAEFGERDPALRLRFRRALQGDLDAVLLHALAASPEQRYPDVASLVGDLRAWLDLRAVSARRHGSLHRAALHLRRNPMLTAVSALALLAVGLAMGTALIANRALERRAAELETLVSFQSDMLLGVDPHHTGQVLQESLRSALVDPDDPEWQAYLARPSYTDIALDMLDAALLTPSLEEARRRFADQPTVLATLLQSLAYSYRELGRLEQAVEPQAEAVALRRLHLGEGDTLHLMSLREQLKLVRRRFSEGGEAMHRNALELHVRHLGHQHLDTARAQGGLAQWLQSERRHEEAESLLRDALERIERSLGAEHRDAVAVRANLAKTVSDQHRFAEAEPLYGEVIAQAERVFGPTHDFTLSMRNNLAFTLRNLGRLDEAAALYQAVYETRRERLGELHMDTLISLNNFSAVTRARGDLDSAEGLARRAWQGMRSALGENHRHALQLQFNLGGILTELDRDRDAEPLLAEALVAWNEGGHPANSGLVSALIHLARMRRERDDTDAAEGFLLTAWERAQTLPEPVQRARVARELAAHYGEDGEDGQRWAVEAAALAAPADLP
ncbi:MAG TPA: serine/threonine-protein kinase [Xanthomonadaceae bacterium]|nr:serine/threonine-protein kinase [Xanthomonadaceae bacterium]